MCIRDSTSTGLYRVREVDVEEARRLVRLYGWVSAVGHAATAAVFSRILAVDVPMNRVEYTQQAGQLAIALKLHQRAPEGQVLSVEEMLKIGFSPVSYTHLDVYKRQARCRGRSPKGPAGS